ncbi:MAG: cytochrome c peroxidase [Bacteroidota bacterium]
MRRYYFLLLGVSCFFLLAATIDLDNLFQYAGQSVPTYISKDNTPPWNDIADEGATLGRVLFYDKTLSLNSTIACASCHQQEFAFSDTAVLSVGLAGGLTGRHAMRLVNARFGDEVQFFWDERATSLEDQSTRPIQDHVEMGFSGTNGDPALDSLIRRMDALPYYPRLFNEVYGDSMITEERMQRALAQFIRSIQSFDSRYDVGRAQAINEGMPFLNFTQQENMGKALFILPPGQGGAGCGGCHRPPEFDIVPNSGNNGVISVAGDTSAIDVNVTRAPSLRDLINPQGVLNGPLMHDGSFTSLMQVIEHYDSIPDNPMNTNLDQRLGGAGGPPGGPPPVLQNLQLTDNEKLALEAFLMTLTGTNIYTDEKWSNPFDSLGHLTILPMDTTSTDTTGNDSTTTGIADRFEELDILLYPNPASEIIQIEAASGRYQLSIFQMNGAMVMRKEVGGSEQLNLSQLPKGLLIFRFEDLQKHTFFSQKIMHR